MKRYYCEFCKVHLFNNHLAGRLMHLRGSKHNLIKKTYFIEIMSDKDKIKYLQNTYRQANINKKF
ncbi:hypothetical protein H311_00818 [Anncaliia algerae PRA109]|nr:hypothetical protein H311_01485 [Anncaliia algerae PRA109]KCZ78158.1 hypothetical protein H311_00818 [Anncaliia algerae PRA109]